MSPYIHEAVPHRHKRVRFSPNGSSEPSVSDLASTTGASSTTNASDYGSDGDSSDVSPSSDEPSDDSSSSEEDEDEGEDTEMEEETEQDGVVILRANRGKKPVMKLADDEDHGPDIRSFLKDFLPKLKESNEELERQRKAGTLKSLDDGGEEEGEPYIEMVSRAVLAGMLGWAYANVGAVGSWTRCTRRKRPE
jgi:hypothetical protein